MAHVAAAIAVQLANTAVETRVVSAGSDRCLAVEASKACWTDASVGIDTGDLANTVVYAGVR